MPWAADPFCEPIPIEVERIAQVLDPVVTPLGFAPGQAGVADGRGQVIFCRGIWDSADGGCVDLVVDAARDTEWRITGVRYWGSPSNEWQLGVEPDAELSNQLDELARTLPSKLA
jgi:hypothetical protein